MLGAAVNGLLRLATALAALPLLSCGFYYPESDPDTGSMPEDRAATAPRFHSAVDAALSWWLATHPTEAGALGIHDYDGQLDRVSKSDLASRVEALKKQLFRLGAAVRGDLPASDLADAEVLELRLRAELHEIEGVREWARNPGYYASLLNRALWPLALGDPESGERRLGFLSARLEQVTSFLQSARENLEQVPRLCTETAIENFGGLLEVVRAKLPAAFEAVREPGLRRRFDEARAAALEALSKFLEWMKSDLLPKSTGVWALGREALALKLRFEAGVEDPLETLQARGTQLLRQAQEAAPRAHEQGLTREDPSSHEGSAAAQRTPDPAPRMRTRFVSRIFAEGWAQYAEGNCKPSGFDDDGTPHRTLVSVCRYVAALEMHAYDMKLEQAATFFEKEGRLERSRAEREARQVALDPGLLYATLGQYQILELREAWRLKSGRTRQEFDRELNSLGGGPPLSVARRLMLEGR